MTGWTRFRIVMALLGGGVGIGLALAVMGLPQSFAQPFSIAASPTGETLTYTLYVPMVFRDYLPASGRLCRFGVGAGTDIGSYPVNSLRIGWYIDWTATLSPARPGGITYVPTIRLRQTGPDSYAYSPSGTVLSATIAANPDALWLIGNEPDRRHWQDDLEPHLYARAYHELYHLIKGIDPDAQIGAGGIVQPTPVRLRYLDMVLQSYREQFGGPMPVDVWNIHAFILRERSCDCYEDCWGAEIPPGIDECDGMLYEIQDNDNLEIFKQHIVRFREWMAARGYQDRPLIITEFGVQMWPEYGFPPERVNAYMNATFDYLMTITSPLGYPADGYRLVQRWAWYSLTDENFNGWLFDPETGARTVFGDNFAAYTSRVPPVVNLTPVKIWTDPAVPFSSGESVTLTLYVQVANSGHISTDVPVAVSIYDGNPDEGGEFIGTGQISSGLDGCGTWGLATVVWPGVSPGAYQVYVVIDPVQHIAESDESDNILTKTIVVATVRLWLPLILKSAP